MKNKNKINGDEENNMEINEEFIVTVDLSRARVYARSNHLVLLSMYPLCFSDSRERSAHAKLSAYVPTLHENRLREKE